MRALVVAIAVMVSGAAGAAGKEIHKPFAYYSTGPVYAGPTVSPDLSSREAYNYRSRLRAAAQNPPNFASEYRIVTWGCGTSCETGAAINLRTGRIAFFPFTICCSSKNFDPGFERIQYRQDSALIVFSGLLNEQGEDAEHHYVIGDETFRLISAHPFSQKSAQQERNEIPIIDVESLCKEAHQNNNLQSTICIETEQSNYNMVKWTFPKLSEKAKIGCLQSILTTKIYHYTRLWHCVNVEYQRSEIERKKTAPPPTFRY